MATKVYNALEAVKLPVGTKIKDINNNLMHYTVEINPVTSGKGILLKGTEDSFLHLNNFTADMEFVKVQQPVTFEEVKKCATLNKNIKVNIDYGEGMVNGDVYHTLRWTIDSLIKKTSNDNEFISRILEGNWFIEEGEQ